MNSQERALLESFLDQLVRVRGIDKDAEADSMIRGAVGQQPDASYLLVQRALLLSQALDQAKTRIAELERTQKGSSRGFLDSSAARWSGTAPPASTATTAPAGAPAVSAGPYSQPPAPPSWSPYVAPPGAAMPAQSGASSFLGQAAATAAGVAGGAFLFEGLEGMLGHHESFGSGPEAATPFAGPEDVTVNNYYASDDRSAGSDDSPAEDEDEDEDEDEEDDDPDAGDDPDVQDDSSDFV
jgi:uncharacterized protein